MMIQLMLWQRNINSRDKLKFVLQSYSREIGKYSTIANEFHPGVVLTFTWGGLRQSISILHDEP
ncbi:hypothetical protein QG37_07133 [Candidozyma auris]|uniref:Uncharacterized protein n=1 Tax=Candidozyma auris TaxID=498019 RepID=A0A0L0NR95_CANAR|nr:hypothetical protein QG37_07133 [[Candida] auris]